MSSGLVAMFGRAGVSIIGFVTRVLIDAASAACRAAVASSSLLSASCCSSFSRSIGFVGSSTWRTMTFTPVRERGRCPLFADAPVATTGATPAGSFGCGPAPEAVFSTAIGVGTLSVASARAAVAIFATSTFVRSCSTASRRRGIDPIKLRGFVFGSSCGRINFSIAAFTAFTFAGNTNTNVVPHRAASAALSIADAPIS